MSGRYDDMLELPHHTSAVHPRMSRLERAAQFSPFAALTGYEETIRETGRLTQQEVILSEDIKAELDRTMQQLLSRPDRHPLIAVTYFQPDARKKGGAYRTVVQRLKRIDPTARTMVLADGLALPLDRVTSLEVVDNCSDLSEW